MYMRTTERRQDAYIPQRQHNNSMIKAKGKTTYLKAASEIRKKQSHELSNKAIIRTLISGLDSHTGSAQVAVHIRRETGLTVRPEKLQLRNEGRTSRAFFFVRCNERDRYKLMDEYLWPVGTIIKPYWG